MAETANNMAMAAKIMVSLKEARTMIIDAVPIASAQSQTLVACNGLVIAEDIIAAHHQPWAALSAMDGYAVRLGDCKLHAVLPIIGESRAGAPFSGMLEAGQAIAISTGAAVPSGADHIIMVEHSERYGDAMRVVKPQSPNGFIRQKGQDFSAGDALIRKGALLSPAHIALAAATGKAECMVVPPPKVAIITNGDELLDPGAEPQHGYLYDSNGVALAAQCSQWGADAHWLGRAGDDPDAVSALMESALQYDIIIIAGGASVGQHDHVRSSFAALGGVLHFSKVALRPGKPAWFGILSGKPVIGLPGNPASAFVTAELLVRPAVEKHMAHAPQAALSLETMRLDGSLSANGGREAFLRGYAATRDGETLVTPAADQDSSLLRPLTAANVLIHRDVDADAAKHGDPVKSCILRPIGTQA